MGAVWHVGSSRTREQTHGPRKGRQLPHPWITREGPGRGCFGVPQGSTCPRRASPWPRKLACADIGDVMSERFSSSPVFSGFTLAA